MAAKSAKGKDKGKDKGNANTLVQLPKPEPSPLEIVDGLLASAGWGKDKGDLPARVRELIASHDRWELRAGTLATRMKCGPGARKRREWAVQIGLATADLIYGWLEEPGVDNGGGNSPMWARWAQGKVEKAKEGIRASAGMWARWGDWGEEEE